MKLYLVGFGPGHLDGMTIRAKQCIEDSDVIVGYTVYVDLLKPLFPDKEYYTTPMRQEAERAAYAIRVAKSGRNVAMVCSGDSVVYGMAGLVFELLEKEKKKEVTEAQTKGEEEVEVEVIPGVTAALSGSALLGAPLTHDFCVISLSDLLTPWEKIEKRLQAAAAADFEIVLYNPVSKKRSDYLRKACDILLTICPEETVCGFAMKIGREGEQWEVTTLGGLKEKELNMFTTVFIGNSQTRQIDGRMVTPRGYPIG